MVRNTQAQAACLLLLLLASLASTSELQHQTQSADLQSPGTSAATSQTDLKPVMQRLWKRDSHFPICLFCCNCCGRSCGICCRT